MERDYGASPSSTFTRPRVHISDIRRAGSCHTLTFKTPHSITKTWLKLTKRILSCVVFFIVLFLCFEAESFNILKFPNIWTIRNIRNCINDGLKISWNMYWDKCVLCFQHRSVLKYITSFGAIGTLKWQNNGKKKWKCVSLKDKFNIL